MTQEQRIRLETALLNFVERVSEEKATPDEVRALPYIAQILVELMR